MTKLNIARSYAFYVRVFSQDPRSSQLYTHKLTNALLAQLNSIQEGTQQVQYSGMAVSTSTLTAFLMRTGYTSVDCMEKILLSSDKHQHSKLLKKDPSQKQECLIIPPYSSNIILEAYTDENGLEPNISKDYLVRILYNGQAIDLNYGRGSTPKYDMLLREFTAWAEDSFKFPDEAKFESYCKMSQYKL